MYRMKIEGNLTHKENELYENNIETKIAARWKHESKTTTSRTEYWTEHHKFAENDCKMKMTASKDENDDERNDTQSNKQRWVWKKLYTMI